ncbi:hypothetical protein BDW22DRAFT_648089 [Trametopsis cervina]|nr:hypothetical protein BDW22DRAFT_648089 [Trametopsis cervina]
MLLDTAGPLVALRKAFVPLCKTHVHHRRGLRPPMHPPSPPSSPPLAFVYQQANHHTHPSHTRRTPFRRVRLHESGRETLGAQTPALLPDDCARYIRKQWVLCPSLLVVHPLPDAFHPGSVDMHTRLANALISIPPTIPQIPTHHPENPNSNLRGWIRCSGVYQLDEAGRGTMRLHHSDPTPRRAFANEE